MFMDNIMNLNRWDSLTKWFMLISFIIMIGKQDSCLMLNLVIQLGFGEQPLDLIQIPKHQYLVIRIIFLEELIDLSFRFFELGQIREVVLTVLIVGNGLNVLIIIVVK